MSRDAATITGARETTCDNPGMTGRLVHHRGVGIIVTTCAFHHGHVQCQAKKDAAIVATKTLRAIRTTIVAIEDRKSDSNEQHMKATAVTSAKPHAIGRLPGVSRSLDKARLPRQF